MACSAARSASSGFVSARRLPRMLAARPGSAVNGYALPFAAAWVADLLSAVLLGLPLAARGIRDRGPAALAPCCATGASLAMTGARRPGYVRPARPSRPNVGGGE